MGQLRRILTSGVLPMHTKRLLILTFVRTRLLYGAESWPVLTPREMAVIEAPMREAMVAGWTKGDFHQTTADPHSRT
eukprot:12891144-Prorocentrum_lima.AAC.1